MASSKHLMEDDQSQPSTSKISEDHDVGSCVTTLTSIMDTEIRNKSLLSSSIKDAFDPISSNKAGGMKYNRIVQALVFFICKYMRPFNIVEGEGFLRLVKELEPTFKVPGAKYLKKRTTEKYEACVTIYPSTCGRAIQKLKTMVVGQLSRPSESEDDISSIAPPEYDFLKHHKELAYEHKKKNKSHQGDEVSLYLLNPVVSLKSKPCAEWNG
ncbi:unnamed protein product [Parnassius apollo]|uniref:(apollo) hypothetical protein n=1 Tax=Parnassius apollo TaxID=110799 RepID=A0A8S3Y8E6_PARAO|nr:unnamed protein product [Parnassius apollo]